MSYPKRQKFILTCILMMSGLLLTACEVMESRHDFKSIEKKPIKEKTAKGEVVSDITKLTLEEIHNLPDYRDCKKLLLRAELELNKRPVVPIIIKSIKGLSDDIDVDNIFYLEPTAEKYPMDSSIRSYKCPKKIQDVKVIYNLKQGSAYAPWYHFTYYGDIKGIDTSIPSKPTGKIEIKYGDEPPLITLLIDKLQVVSLNPMYMFSNEDMDFTLENIILGKNNHVSFKFKNRGDSNLFIRKFRITFGNYELQVDFKKNIVNLGPGEVYSGKNVISGTGKIKWSITDGDKYIPFVARVAYRSGWAYKKLRIKRIVRIKDLRINKK